MGTTAGLVVHIGVRSLDLVLPADEICENL